MEFDDSIVRFNILDAMKHPVEEYSVFHIDVIDDLVEEIQSSLYEKFPELCDLDDSAVCFSCDQCDGVLCLQCAEIDAFLIGGELKSVDVVEEIHVKTQVADINSST